jgi:hypothetical protein
VTVPGCGERCGDRRRAGGRRGDLRHRLDGELARHADAVVGLHQLDLGQVGLAQDLGEFADRRGVEGHAGHQASPSSSSSPAMARSASA